LEDGTIWDISLEDGSLISVSYIPGQEYTPYIGLLNILLPSLTSVFQKPGKLLQVLLINGPIGS